MNDWMIDLETTGLRPDRAAILSIGAVKFDRQTFEPGMSLYWPVAMLEGRSWDDDTRAWWLKQSPEAYALATAANGREPVVDVLQALATVVGPEPYLWAKPAHFDFPFLQGYFADAGVTSPFGHRRVIDVRSWIASRGEGALARQAAFEAEAFIGVAHQPVDDCLWQIKLLKETCA